jgi:hypothetical protein
VRVRLLVFALTSFLSQRERRQDGSLARRKAA